MKSARGRRVGTDASFSSQRRRRANETGVYPRTGYRRALAPFAHLASVTFREPLRSIA